MMTSFHLRNWCGNFRHFRHLHLCRHLSPALISKVSQHSKQEINRKLKFNSKSEIVSCRRVLSVSLQQH